MQARNGPAYGVFRFGPPAPTRSGAAGVVWERNAPLRACEGAPNAEHRVGDPGTPVAGGSNAINSHRPAAQRRVLSGAADSESVRSFLCLCEETSRVPGELVTSTGHVYAGFRVSGVCATDGPSNQDGGRVRSDAVRRYPCRGRPALASRARCPRHIYPYEHTTNRPSSVLPLPAFSHRHDRADAHGLPIGRTNGRAPFFPPFARGVKILSYDFGFLCNIQEVWSVYNCGGGAAAGTP
jgi:hypothetical protein